MCEESVSFKGSSMCKGPEWENVLRMLKEQTEEEKVGDEVPLKRDH